MSSGLGRRRQQLSPRVGAAYRADRTVLRGSVSRFFQPPQPENFLLSSSEEARVLSPFATEGGSGGAELEPERQWMFEAGVNHQFASRIGLDAAVWRRTITDAADPNVFAGTTIIFPNAVARGRAAGIDLRVELPRRSSWSGYLNFSVGRVRQNGPITGGLFLEDDIADVASGEEFIPDHDQLVAGRRRRDLDARARGQRSPPRSDTKAARRCSAATRIWTSCASVRVPSWWISKPAA